MISLQKEIRVYLPAIFMDGVLGREQRKIIRTALFVVMLLVGLLAAVLMLREVVISDVVLRDAAARYDTLLGVFLIIFSILISFYLFAFFYNTLYYRGLRFILDDEAPEGGISYEVAEILNSDSLDVTRGFLRSRYGKHVLRRCGLLEEEIRHFIESPRESMPVSSLSFDSLRVVSLWELGIYLYTHDTVFKKFLFASGIRESDYFGATEWVVREELTEKYFSRWWSKDNLGRVHGIGRGLSFGVAYDLRRYMRNLMTSSVFSYFGGISGYADEVEEKIETILSRTKAANVILIGEPGVGKMDILIALGRKMYDGTSVASITGKRLVVFDQDAFIATHSSKEEFEAAFLNLLIEAERAGNIIIVIENMSSFLANTKAFDVDVAELLEKFLISPDLQIVGTVDPASYHESVEARPQFLAHFEPVHVESPDLGSTIRVLEDVARSHEEQYHIFFVYQAIEEIAESADRYIMEGVMPDKAVTLLAEIASLSEQRGTDIIRRELVQKAVSEKTGIASGPVEGKERETLMNLEKHLHERIIGQDTAIKAIARALRRSRSGIQSGERPIGTFLFLGSTGVGKTETAKALAAVFFGSEERMNRLDMSEFSGKGAIERLIGKGNAAGTLSAMLREHPYGVLLLDEFEKASKHVRNLFLQVLDEGQFTDARGVRVNARNTIIIATSNAGSEYIWQMAKEGKDARKAKDAIIDEIIANDVLSPELLNRFDEVIIFEALKQDQQITIAKLMLEELKDRIEKKGFNLEINDLLVHELATRGFDPEFGARPMQRVLQDQIEEKIASKIIAGGLKPGDTITFTEEDFQTTL